jgi:ATP-dependent exoDNAse (exonuclease V) alpha subunit
LWVKFFSLFFPLFFFQIFFPVKGCVGVGVVVCMFSFDFTLDGQRDAPDLIKDFNGYFKGPCRIVDCKTHPYLVGQLKTLCIYNMISINPAFVYRTNKATLKTQSIDIDKKEIVSVIEMRKTIGQVEMCYIYEEIGIQKERIWKKPKGTDVLMDILHQKTIEPPQLMQNTLLAPLIEKSSDLIRLQYIQPLSLFFVNSKGTLCEEQRENIREQTTEKLIELFGILKTRPWELAFREVTLPIMPIIKSQYERACTLFKISVPRHIVLSMRIYYSCMEQMHEENHTFFQWVPEARKFLNILEYDTLAPMVIEFMERYALTWIDVEKTGFALKTEYSEGKMICQALMKVAERSSEEHIELRDHNVPTKPPRLTQDQQRIAQHVCENYLTIVEGLPGTGKTVLIEWVMCRMKNVLLCTLTGMMTKSLRVRMGNRNESAYTIDYLISVAKHVKKGKAWLKRFEVLVIDEFSNTSTKGLAWLLAYLTNLKRIVFVGDHEQIGSINPGDAMGDLKSLFQTRGHAFRLTEILRVQKDLEDLCMAPLLMSQKRHRELAFSKEGPLTLVEKKASMTFILKDILDEVFSLKKSLMAHQIVVLQNDIRQELNEECQRYCIEKGIITKQNAKRDFKIGSRTYYVGSKITFLENYNKPFKYSIEPRRKKKGGKEQEDKNVLISDCVANGETGVITSIKIYGAVLYIEFIDDDRPNGNPLVKHVLCNVNGAVKARDIDLGYATTTTKVQGREFEYLIFWNNHHPAPCWTRAHAYVALSRGKKRVWCVSSASDLYAICDRPNKPRKTILSLLLKVCSKELLQKFRTLSFPFQDMDVAVPWVLLPHTVPCVPVLEEEEEKEKEQVDL